MDTMRFKIFIAQTGQPVAFTESIVDAVAIVTTTIVPGVDRDLAIKDQHSGMVL
jgi:hypothetical protein